MAIVNYPTTFPCPLVGGYSVTADMGLLRTDFANGGSRQRRRYETMPQFISMSFGMKASDLNLWLIWVNTYAYDWVLFPVVTYETPDFLKPRQTPLVIRFISNIQYRALDADIVEVVVEAETMGEDVSATADPDAGLWIIGRTPSNPAVNYVVSGTPSNPAVP